MVNEAVPLRGARVGRWVPRGGAVASRGGSVQAALGVGLLLIVYGLWVARPLELDAIEHFLEAYSVDGSGFAGLPEPEALKLSQWSTPDEGGAELLLETVGAYGHLS